MTDRPTVKVNCILDAQNNEIRYFDTVIPKKKLKIGPKYSQKPAKNHESLKTTDTEQNK